MASQLRKKQLLAEMGATVPALAGTAKLQAQDVGEQQKQLEQAGVARLHYGNEAMALKSSLAQSKMQNDLARSMIAANSRIQAAGMGGAGDPQAIDIAEAIMRGEQPPDTKGLYRAARGVRAHLARNGYDLTTAQRDWQGVQAHIKNLNSTQQLRLRQAVETTSQGLDQIEQLYNRWQELAPVGVSGMKLLNRAQLAAAKNLPGEAGAVANALDAQINDLAGELGNVYMAGNTPTDHSMRLAASNLKSEWNQKTFEQALKTLRTALRMRSNSISNSMPQGVTPGSHYVEGMPGATPAKGADNDPLGIRK
jgi:hypothetical protein